MMSTNLCCSSVPDVNARTHLRSFSQTRAGRAGRGMVTATARHSRHHSCVIPHRRYMVDVTCTCVMDRFNSVQTVTMISQDKLSNVLTFAALKNGRRKHDFTKTAGHGDRRGGAGVSLFWLRRLGVWSLLQG